MSPATIILFAACLALGQTPASSQPAAAPSAAIVGPSQPLPEPASQGPIDRSVVLKQALADFDSAVARREHGGPESRALFRRALGGFEAILRDGAPNGYIYYNIANAHLRLGDVGRAVANYRRATKLCPGDARIAKNLQVARDLCKTQVPIPAAGALVETVLFWHYDTSLSGRLRVALGAYIVLWLLLALRLFAFRHAPAMAWTIRVVAAVALITAASVAWDAVGQRRNVEGAVVADEAVLRKGNGEYYEPLLDRPLSSGVEFRILESREDVQQGAWYLIRLRDGKEGWLRADEADVI